MRARRLAAAMAGALGFFPMAGCIYEVPITDRGTQAVEARLVGNWVSADGKSHLRVRKLDEAKAVVVLNDLVFGAYHSEVGGRPYVTLQELDTAERKYAYVSWRLSPDGRRLEWRAVSTKVIPKDAGSAGAVRALLEKHRDDPALLEALQVYSREKKK